ncbi:aminotransferase class III-fold pyridoxal phosphate-dependent enzyme [Paraburkholderia bryophila]|uniref:aminotransferase class III-fold pyridoxal phosphate-dependent enzyme n=1 Tax=Paraburkholderia bryophila TaxID=420952 RepID=UPI002349C063|nr:aminotransferase class III-fold pyridoxal phosphate-dependent enzyme [Paraburkholderia bryophila]WCM23152.1 aminotransferase class III-fold pyridoxal phosphate-dependent enzyme [Paraburkholderia bryophila]
MKMLWEAADRGVELPLSSLPVDLQACITGGDGVADHYGGRTGFTFVEQSDDCVLFVELSKNDQIVARSAVNLTGGYGTGILGSATAVLAGSMASSVQRAATANDEFHSPARFRLVKLVKEAIAAHTASDPADWDITFTSTGTEAMDLALQLVCLDGFDLATGLSKRREKDVIVACHGAWHGWGLGPTQLLDRRQFTDGLPKLAGQETVFMIYNDIDSLRRTFDAFRGRIRAVVVEGILGDGGVIPASNEWWAELIELAERENARVIDDEILSGFRTGQVLAVPPGIQPSCITLGKALGLGLFPMSAVAWRKATLSIRLGAGVRTFNARPYQATLVSEAIEYISNEGLMERSSRLGTALIQQLRTIVDRYPRVFKDVRGQGLFVGLELADAYARDGRGMRDRLLRHGVLVEVESGIFNRRVPKPSRINETLRLTPPLTISEANLRNAVSAIDTCCSELDAVSVAA